MRKDLTVNTIYFNFILPSVKWMIALYNVCYWRTN